MKLSFPTYLKHAQGSMRDFVMVSFVMKRAQNIKSDVMVLGGWYPIILIHY